MLSGSSVRTAALKRSGRRNGKVLDAQYTIARYKDLLGVHAARLEDHVAYVARLAQDAALAVQASKAATASVA